MTISPRARTAMLACIAAATSILYWTLISISLDPLLPIVHNVSSASYSGPLTLPARWLHLTGAGPEIAEMAFIFIMAAVSLLWLAALFLVRKDRSMAAGVVILGGFAVFATLFVLAPAFQSSDVFNYIFGGRAMSVYRSNPYTLLPSMKPHDPFFQLIGWKNTGSVYGPAFSYLSCLLTRIAGNGVWANVVAFKLLAAASYAACLPLVYSLARRISPGRENLALAMSAWCPVLIMHIPGAGHNDMLATVFVLGGYLLFRKGRLLAGIAVVAFALNVKLTAGLALLPILVLYVRDRRGAPLKRLASGVLTCLAVAALPYAAFWQGPRIFEGTRQVASLFSASSVPDLVSNPLANLLASHGVSPVQAETLARGSAHLIFLAVFLAGAVLLLRRVVDFASMSAAAASLVLLWLLTSTYVLPWYLTLGVMLAAFTGWNRTSALMVATATVLTMYRLPLSGDPTGGTTVYIALPLLVILVGWGLMAALPQGIAKSRLGRARALREEDRVNRTG